MKYKVNQLVWFVDSEMNITRCLIVGASLNRDALPIYSIVKVLNIKYGENGNPTTIKLAEDWGLAATDEADLYETHEDALGYIHEAIEMTEAINRLTQ